MKARIFLILGALLASLFASAQNVWTLEQCIDTALMNNRNIKQKQISKKTNEIAYQQAKLDLLPNLNASASQGFSFGRSLMADNTYQNTNSSQTSYGFSSGITLFDGLRMKYNIDARMAELKVSEAELEKIKQDIIISVSTAYLQVLMNKELLLIANDQLKLSQTKIEQRKALVEAGKIAEGELFELLAQESKENMNKIKAEQTLKYSMLELAQILELQSFENMDVIVPENLMSTQMELINIQNVFENAITHRPEIKSAEFSLDKSMRDVKIAKSAYYPNLNFGVNVGGGYYNSVSVPLSTNLGFNLSVPIFNKFETKNQVKTAQLNVENNKLYVENAKMELRKNIQQAYHNALAAKARWEAALVSVQSGTEAYRFVNQKYEADKANVYELYQAKSNLAQVQSEVTQSKFEYAFRIKILEWLK